MYQKIIFGNHSTPTNNFVERPNFFFLMFFYLSRLKSVCNVQLGGIVSTYVLTFWNFLATYLGPNSGILSALRSISKSHEALPFCASWPNKAASTNGSSSESVVVSPIYFIFLRKVNNRGHNEQTSKSPRTGTGQLISIGTQSGT